MYIEIYLQFKTYPKSITALFLHCHYPGPNNINSCLIISNNLICLHASTLAPPATAYSQQNSQKYASKTHEIQSLFYLSSVLCSVMT